MMLLWIGVVSVLVAQSLALLGPCWDFTGQGHLVYGPDNFDLSRSAHYNFSFKTGQANGILLYAHGIHDYEAVFTREGLLHYFMFNPGPYGIGRTGGVHFRSGSPVNNDTWINVEVVRNWKLPQRNEYPRQSGQQEVTGMILRGGVGEERYLHQGSIPDVNIVPPVYFGGTIKSVSQTIGNFVGQIKDIHEYVTGHVVYDPTGTPNVRRCVDQSGPQ